MKRFATLVSELDQTQDKRTRHASLVRYFADEPPEDAAWAIELFLLKRRKRLVTAAVLQQAAKESSALPDWLFTLCSVTVGDPSETAALILPRSMARELDRHGHSPLPPVGEVAEERSGREGVPAGAAKSPPNGLAYWIEHRVTTLASRTPKDQCQLLNTAWAELDPDSRYVFNKLATGSVGVSVSRSELTAALATAFNIAAATVAHRLEAACQPTREAFDRLTCQEQTTPTAAAPIPWLR